jgi:hypothetical protein
MAGAEDAGLLLADQLERIPEPVAMIEADRRQHRGIGVEEVGGIEAAAETHLQHRHVHGGRCEQQQGCQGVVFKEGEGRVRARRLDALEGADERRIVDLGTADADALVVTQQVRGGEEPDTRAARREQSLQVHGDGALAVGAAHGDDRAGNLAHPEPAGHPRHALEPHVDRVRVHRLLQRQPVRERAHRGGKP